MKFRFLLLMIFTLVFSAGCHRAQHQTEEQTLNFLALDSVWTPTGNMLLDSLLQLVTTAPIDTNLAKLYYEIGERYEDTDVETAKTYYQKLERLSQHLNWNEGKYLYVLAYSNLLMRIGNLDSALIIVQTGYNLAVQENNETVTADMTFNKGNIYFMKECFYQALNCYSEVFVIYEKNGDKNKLQTIYWMTTLIYQTIGEIDKAIECGEKSIALNNENPYSFLCLAIAYQATQERDKSMANYEEALRLATLQENLYLIGTIYNYFANEALLILDLERAEKYAHKSLEFAQLFGPAWCATCYMVLSKVEELKKNTDKSEEYAKETQQIVEELNAFEEKKFSYFFLSEICFAHRKYGDHSKYYVEWDIFDITRSVGMTYHAAEEMFTNYILSKKNNEIELQKHIIARQNLQRWLLIGGIIVCLIILTLLWYILLLRSRRNRALVETNTLKDKFYGIISHDMKIPAITQRDAILLLANNIHQLDRKTIDGTLKELLESAEEEVALIYNLLNWAQVQTGKISYKPDTFHLASCLRPVMTLIQIMVNRKEITFQSQIPENAVVTADRNMIATIVRNLLTNAVKYTASGGTVKLEVTPCDDTKYIVSITDTGIGISPEKLSKIFSLDSHHSQYGTDGETGTGLGLIVCRELLEKHGIKLQVESEVGKGSRFWFELHS